MAASGEPSGAEETRPSPKMPCQGPEFNARKVRSLSHAGEEEGLY